MLAHDDQTPVDHTPTLDTSTGGEDEGSTERDGDDSHMHDDQKARAYLWIPQTVMGKAN